MESKNPPQLHPCSHFGIEMRNHRTAMSESFISFQMLSFVIIQLAFLPFPVRWNRTGSDKKLLHLHLWQTDHIWSYITQHTLSPSEENDGLATQSAIINTWEKSLVKSLFKYVINGNWNNRRLSDDVCSSLVRKTPTGRQEDSLGADWFLNRKGKMRSLFQHSPHVHLYTNMFSWVLCYLSCCQRYWRTQFASTLLRTSFSIPSH